jgi:hypothetical protein
MKQTYYHNDVLDSYRQLSRWQRPKLLVIGHARHGKDTVCEILRDNYGFDFESSSRFCSKKFLFDKLKDKYGYKTEEECYEDRHNHRSEWFDEICAYNVPDPSRLGREIALAHGVYCGLRNKKEFHALKSLEVYDFVLWVDRSDHLPLEPKTSMNLEQWMADFTIDNNGSLEELQANIKRLSTRLFKKYMPVYD